MHEYDTALKTILRRLKGSLIPELTGFAVKSWINVELPLVQSPRVDMLGRTADGTLLHIELQSANQPGMALRMLEYAAAIHRQYGSFPQQVVLYVGNSPLRMKEHIDGPHLDYSCRMVDIRVLDSGPLITSSRVEDNVIAVLARFGNNRAAVKRILRGIATKKRPERADALAKLTLLAGLRDLGPVIEGEVKQMPILNDIMDHPVLGRERKLGIKLGLEKGLEKGLERGREEGREEGERQIILRMIAKRFGPAPAPLVKRIKSMTAPKLEQMALKLLDAASLDELTR